MSDLATRDYTEDLEILRDPYPFFEAIRRPGGVFHDAERDIYYVTGFDEAVGVLLDHETFSSNIAVHGPKHLPTFGGTKEQIREQLAEFRSQNAVAELLVNYDGLEHSNVRGLLDKLFTPSRLKANEEYMTRLADSMVAEALALGKAEMVKSFSAKYVTLVIADLLGVPDADRDTFRDVIDKGPPAGNMNQDDERPPHATLEFLGGYFFNYINERRERDMGDVMSELAHARFPDGTLPDLFEVVKASMFLFAAGQDTSAKLVANSLLYLCENPAMQDRLRANPGEVPSFIEEMLRLEGSTKATFRLALEDAMVGDTLIPAGKALVVGLAAGNRDPGKWDDPLDFRLDRAGIRQHLAFGRGKHTCIGAALARAEVIVLLRSLLRATSAIRIDETQHGPPGARRLSYEPSYIIRGLDALHLVLEPA
jgi:cytochrome P450